MKQKIGLKLWSNNSDLFHQGVKLIESDIFQYIEINVVPGTCPDIFSEYDIPYVIHGTTDAFGFDMGNISRLKQNNKLLQNNIDWADKLNSNIIILHPGINSLNNTCKFLDTVADNRIIIENMPRVGINDELLIGSTPKEIKSLINNKFGFCLDINHAIKSSTYFKEDYLSAIKQYLALKPSLIHLCDGNQFNCKDEHLHLNDGNYDLKEIKHLICKSTTQYMTMETPRYNSTSLNEDIANLTTYHKIC